MNETAKHPYYEEALHHVRELRGFYVSVFAFRGWLDERWQERKIREYLDRRG